MSDSTFKATLSRLQVKLKVELSRKVFENIKVEDAFALTYGPEELFNYCQIIQTPSYSFDLKACHILFNITESFMASRKCFTLKLKTPQAYSYVTVQRMKLYPGAIGVIALKPYVRNVTASLLFYRHPSATYVSDGLIRYLYLSPLRLFTLTHSTFTKELLPAPYETKCNDYTLSGYLDRGDCYEACVNTRSLERLGKLAPGPLVLLDESRGKYMIAAATVLANSTLREIIIQINDGCDDYCSKPDCKSTYHVPSVMITAELEFPSLASYVEQQPVIDTVYRPRHNIVTYITDLFSTLGFWIGVSGLTIFDALWNILTRHRKAKSGRDPTAVQLAALERSQKQMAAVQSSLVRLTRQLYADVHSPGNLSQGGILEKQYGHEPIFRANFFKL
ncbi:hypothetical protein HDE_07601 [Halotydeus destructor]|nr:hypothetical protein HDE_07601 [Halotydeus destructor]